MIAKAKFNLNLICVFVLSFCVAVSVSCSAKSKENWKTVSSSPNSNKPEMSESNIKPGGFTANLPASFQQPTDDVGKRILREYGAVFVARGGVVPPPTAVFENAAAVSAFQAKASISAETVGGVKIELQSGAMAALKNAALEVTITPRGSDAARRTYEGTVELWASRVNPGLTHWVGKGRITQADADRIKSLTPFQQVPEIFKLEADGIFFSKDLSKSIIYSVAPPGTSQHLSMLALDVSENDNAQARSILAKHGWYQTVVSDLPHFTFLGVKEADLPSLGLKKVSDGGRTFWLPDIK